MKIKQPTKSALDSLIYISKCTRPDIAFAINEALRNAENPIVSDWHKVTNIFKFFNSTDNYKIIYKRAEEIITFTDVDLGGHINDKKTTYGNIILMGNDPILWISKKKKKQFLPLKSKQNISLSSNVLKKMFMDMKRIVWIIKIQETN